MQLKNITKEKSTNRGYCRQRKDKIINREKYVDEETRKHDQLLREQQKYISKLKYTISEKQNVLAQAYKIQEVKDKENQKLYLQKQLDEIQKKLVQINIERTDQNQLVNQLEGSLTNRENESAIKASLDDVKAETKILVQKQIELDHEALQLQTIILLDTKMSQSRLGSLEI